MKPGYVHCPDTGSIERGIGGMESGSNEDGTEHSHLTENEARSQAAVRGSLYAAPVAAIMSSSRGAGVLLGMACGDALGRPVEFESPETIRSRHGRVTEMLAEGTHRQPAGTITVATELGLCNAPSRVAPGAFVPAAVAVRSAAWYMRASR